MHVLSELQPIFNGMESNSTQHMLSLKHVQFKDNPGSFRSSWACQDLPAIDKTLNMKTHHIVSIQGEPVIFSALLSCNGLFEYRPLMVQFSLLCKGVG
ncbi:hypothetical protein Mapa_013334 [Marchantia paleacea]|nr:hypothetical protein Mapa_013334 [Marchantia paleacea]